MLKYLLQRILHAGLIIFVVTTLVFTLLAVVGNPVRLLLPEDADETDIQRLTEAMGLDQPIHVRYARYMSKVLQGDFGYSWRYNSPAARLVIERVPVTLKVAFWALVFAVAMAVPLGIVSAIKRNTWMDVGATTLAVLGQAMPNFWLGIMLIMVVATQWRLTPVSGYETWRHLILPTITLGTGLAAVLTRLIRSSLLDVIRQDYIRTAQAKGLSARVVLFRHAFRNALIPVITVLGLQLAGLLDGAVITETVFAIPGMGRLSVQALSTLDYNVVQAVVIFSVIIVILANLVVDFLYTLIDPRIVYK